MSTWFLRFPTLRSRLQQQLFPKLTTLRVYAQTYTNEVFYLLYAIPALHTLTAESLTSLPDGRMLERLASNLHVDNCRHCRPTLKPVHLFLPWRLSDAERLSALFPNLRGIGIWLVQDYTEPALPPPPLEAVATLRKLIPSLVSIVYWTRPKSNQEYRPCYLHRWSLDTLNDDPPAKKPRLNKE